MPICGQAVPPSYKQMNICKIHARGTPPKRKEKETTDADADVFNDLTGGAKGGERAELLTGQSDRQKSLGESKLQHGDHSWSWDPEPERCLKMALKRTFAKVIVKMPSQIP